MAFLSSQHDDEDEDEEDLRVDFTFDGESQLGPLRQQVRTSVLELRQMVEDVLAGADVSGLEETLRQLYTKTELAISQFSLAAEKAPDQADFFNHNVAVYSAALGALEQINQAIDLEGDKPLRRAMKRFERVVDQVDKLLADYTKVAELEAAEQAAEEEDLEE